MKTLQQLYNECKVEAMLCLIPFKTRVRIEWDDSLDNNSDCIVKSAPDESVPNLYVIKINNAYSEHENKLKSSILTELIRTCDGCYNYGDQFADYAERLNKKYGYTIAEFSALRKDFNDLYKIIDKDDFISTLQKMNDKNCPSSWCNDINKINKLTNNDIDNYNKIMKCTNKPELEDFNKFKNYVNDDFVSTLQTMNEKCPKSWCENNDIINKISHNKSILDNIDILKKKNIQIEDFKAFEKLCSYKQKYPDVSFDNIDKTSKAKLFPNFRVIYGCFYRRR